MYKVLWSVLFFLNTNVLLANTKIDNKLVLLQETREAAVSQYSEWEPLPAREVSKKFSLKSFGAFQVLSRTRLSFLPMNSLGIRSIDFRYTNKQPITLYWHAKVEGQPVPQIVAEKFTADNSLLFLEKTNDASRSVVLMAMNDSFYLEVVLFISETYDVMVKESILVPINKEKGPVRFGLRDAQNLVVTRLRFNSSESLQYREGNWIHTTSRATSAEPRRIETYLAKLFNVKNTEQEAKTDAKRCSKSFFLSLLKK